MTHQQQRLYVRIRVVHFRLPSGLAFAMRGHIALLVLRSLHTPPPPNLVQRTERMARRLLEMTHIRTAGNATPLHDNDGDPHRLLLHIHVQSQLHQQLWPLRLFLNQQMIGGRADRRHEFHRSLDGA